jgi:hypothetical protein
LIISQEVKAELAPEAFTVAAAEKVVARLGLEKK